jgi:hypothetical protein
VGFERFGSPSEEPGHRGEPGDGAAIGQRAKLSLDLSI